MAEASTGFLIPWGCLKENKVIPIKKRLLRKDIAKPMLRPWAILVASLCPNYLHLVFRGTWLLFGLKRKITWLV